MKQIKVDEGVLLLCREELADTLKLDCSAELADRRVGLVVSIIDGLLALEDLQDES